MLYSTRFSSPLGDIYLQSDGENLTGATFGVPQVDGTVGEGTGDCPALAAARRWLRKYFGGERPDFLPPLKLEGSPFRRAVWDELIKIPYGCTVTYGQIARALESSGKFARVAAQAVGGAVGANPVAVIVPCHRVIGADKSLTGYASGLDIKRALLALEGISVRGGFVL